LFALEDTLNANPKQGNSLGNNTFKVRLADKSKGGGKSGGFRVITYLVHHTDEGTEIFLLSIYDKSELDSVSKATIKEWIAEALKSRR
jgi:hypothetical protein